MTGRTLTTREQNYVTFFSTGTFVAEETTEPIDEWDTDLALRMVTDVTERHDAKPFGFSFALVEEVDVDGTPHKLKTLSRSGVHYICGKVMTLEEAQASKLRTDVFVQHMRSNGWSHIVTATNGFSWCRPLTSGDVVFDAEGKQIWPTETP